MVNTLINPRVVEVIKFYRPLLGSPSLAVLGFLLDTSHEQARKYGKGEAPRIDRMMDSLNALESNFDLAKELIQNMMHAAKPDHFEPVGKFKIRVEVEVSADQTVPEVS